MVFRDYMLYSHLYCFFAHFFSSWPFPVLWFPACKKCQRLSCGVCCCSVQLLMMCFRFKCLGLSIKSNNESQWEWMAAKTNFSLTFPLDFFSTALPLLFFSFPNTIGTLCDSFGSFYLVSFSLFLSFIFCPCVQQTDLALDNTSASHLKRTGLLYCFFLFFFYFTFLAISMSSTCVNHACSRHMHAFIHMTNCENTGSAI